MKELELYLRKSEMRYVLFDLPFDLIVFESNDILDIKNYVKTMVKDFGEEAVESLLLASEEDGFVNGDEILKFIEDEDVLDRRNKEYLNE